MTADEAPPGSEVSGGIARQIGRTGLTLVVAVAGGSALHAFGIPGGMLVGAMAGVAMLSLSGFPTFQHPNAKAAAQILVGTGIGATISRESIALVGAMAIPMLVTIGGLLVFGILFGLWLSRTTTLDRRTALAATMPGGMVEMVLVSDELGADSAVVAAIHLLRIIAVLASLPIVLSLLR